MRIDATRLAAIAQEIRALAGDDEQTFLDTLEGETDVFEALDGMLEDMQETASLAAAARQRAMELTNRARRLEAREAAIRSGMQNLMTVADLRSVRRPAATLSIKRGPSRVDVQDLDQLPTQLCRVTKKPDLATVLRLLKAGETVPGASLRPGDDVLSVGKS